MIPLPFRRLPVLLEAAGVARDRALARAPQGDWGLADQGATVLLTRDQSAGWLTREAGRHLVALGRPLGAPALAELSRTALTRGRAPLLYKCDAATALAARRDGWAVLRLGHEAVLDLDRWSPDRPACRQLRRKLRAATSARLVVAGAVDLPLAAMEQVARDWTARHGRERGFSMGRFHPALLARQRVVLGWQDGRLSGFATFHALGAEWTLDLMRSRAEAPDGTMHRLIIEGAALAREEGAQRLSLAAIPEPAAGRAWMAALGLGSCGLAQFKRSFGPRLLPRYAAAPSAASLAAGLAAVAWAVHRPCPLPAPSEGTNQRAARPIWRPRRTWADPLHFEFEPVAVPCEAPPAQPRNAAAPGRAPSPCTGGP